MIKSNSGNLSLKLFMVFAIILIAARASFSNIPSCYATMPWDSSQGKQWPSASTTTNLSSSNPHNYYKYGQTNDGGRNYWNTTDATWISYAKST